MSRSIHLNKCKREKNYLLQLLGASSTSSSLSYRVLMALARMWLRRNRIHQIQDRYLFCSSYSESWMWASSSFELVRFSPRAPWGIKDEYRACYNNVMCHDYFTSPDLLCDNPGVTMTSHVQSRSLLEYRVSILLAENKVLIDIFQRKIVSLLTLHIKNTLWLDKTWDFQESLCKIFDQAQTPQLSQPLRSYFYYLTQM